MHRDLRIGFLLSFILGSAILLLAWSGGPPPGTTGIPAIGEFPAERTCSQSNCHLGSPLNSGGKLELLGLPAAYTPGATYPLTLRLTSSQSAPAPRWGFELTAARISDGRGTGTFNSTGYNSTPNFVNGRRYISQNFDDLHDGDHGSVDWPLAWTAPDSLDGPIGFFAAGNASNGNFSPGVGDLIYTMAETTFAGSTPVRATTWGGLKSRKAFGNRR